MKEVSQIIRRKGQGLVNELQNNIMFARHHLPDNASTERQLEAEVKIKTLHRVIEQVKEVFELDTK